MQKSTARATYEGCVHRAHEQLYRAAGLARGLGDEGAGEECEALQLILARLMDKSLSGKRYPRRQEQLPLS